LKIPDKGKYKDFGEETFEYFLSKFISVKVSFLARDHERDRKREFFLV
jgi:hypothetical protein